MPPQLRVGRCSRLFQVRVANAVVALIGCAVERHAIDHGFSSYEKVLPIVGISFQIDLFAFVVNHGLPFDAWPPAVGLLVTIYPKISLGIFGLEFGQTQHVVGAEGSIVAHIHFFGTSLAAFCCYHNHAVPRPRAIKSRSRRAFQNGHGFDVVGIEVAGAVAYVHAARYDVGF